jgi:hypothetical protein
MKKPCLEPPVQKRDVDISGHEYQESGKRSPIGHGTISDHRSPAMLMRQMGFEPNDTMTPLQFLVAVMNDDLEKIFKNPTRRKRYEDKGGIGLTYRVECAKTAAKYLHMQMPSVQISEEGSGSFGNQLAKAVTEGNERVRTKRIILETIERISPDMPLPEASYPPAFGKHVTRTEMNYIDATEQELSNAEGDTDYDPDRDD